MSDRFLCMKPRVHDPTEVCRMIFTTVLSYGGRLSPRGQTFVNTVQLSHMYSLPSRMTSGPGSRDSFPAPWFVIAIKHSQILLGNNRMLKHSTKLSNIVWWPSTRYDFCQPTSSDKNWCMLVNKNTYRVKRGLSESPTWNIASMPVWSQNMNFCRQGTGLRYWNPCPNFEVPLF